MATVLTRTTERRRAPRAGAPALGLVDQAVVRPGVPVALLTVSLAGALVASAAPIRPGARTDLAVEAVAGDRWVIGVVVIRCWVADLSPLRYCSALEFDAGVPQGMGSAYPKVV